MTTQIIKLNYICLRIGEKLVFLKAAILNYINGDALKNDFAVGNIIIGFIGQYNVGLTNKILSVR